MSRDTNLNFKNIHLLAPHNGFRHSSETDDATEISISHSHAGVSDRGKRRIKKLKLQMVMPVTIAQWLVSWNIIDNSQYLEADDGITGEIVAILDNKASYNIACGYGVMVALTRTATETNISAFRTANKFPAKLNKYSPKFRSIMWDNISKDLKLGFEITMTDIEKEMVLTNNAAEKSSLCRVVVGVLIQIHQIYFREMFQYNQMKKIVLSMVNALILLKEPPLQDTDTQTMTVETTVSNNTMIRDDDTLADERKEEKQTIRTSSVHTLFDEHFKTKPKLKTKDDDARSHDLTNSASITGSSETLATNVSAVEFFGERNDLNKKGSFAFICHKLAALFRKLCFGNRSSNKVAPIGNAINNDLDNQDQDQMSVTRELDQDMKNSLLKDLESVSSSLSSQNTSRSSKLQQNQSQLR